MTLNVSDIKKLREETGAGVLDVKNALSEAKGDFEKAKADLMKKGLAKADKKSERETKDGLVYSYVHTGGKVGSLIMVACETDFVAKTEDFKALCHNIALQVCTGDYKNTKELQADEFIKDPTKKVSDLVREAIAKLGENIEIKEFAKLSIN